jgi:hypothetical protein
MLDANVAARGAGAGGGESSWGNWVAAAGVAATAANLLSPARDGATENRKDAAGRGASAAAARGELPFSGSTCPTSARKDLLRPLLLLRTLIIHNAPVRDVWFVLKQVCVQGQDGRTPADSHK